MVREFGKGEQNKIVPIHKWAKAQPPGFSRLDVGISTLSLMGSTQRSQWLRSPRRTASGLCCSISGRAVLGQLCYCTQQENCLCRALKAGKLLGNHTAVEEDEETRVAGFLLSSSNPNRTLRAVKQKRPENTQMHTFFLQSREQGDQGPFGKQILDQC